MREEVNRLEVVMPKTEIPEWWDYRDQGGIPIFWVRGKFPIVALALVFDKVNYQAVGLHLFINGEHVSVQRQQYHIFNVAEDHVLLCDLRVSLSDEEWERLDACVGHDNDWKLVQVKCETDMILGQWGVYVYKKETNINDIQFTCPYPDSSGIRSFLVTNAITIPRDEVELESATASSSLVEDSASTIKMEEASCLEHAEVLDDSNPHTRTCGHCCSAILSTFKKLICCNQKTFQDDEPAGSPRLSKARPPPLAQPPPLYLASRLPKFGEWDGAETMPAEWTLNSMRDQTPGKPIFSSNFEDGDDVEKQVPPSFSESLQTVVENLKRVVISRQKKCWGDGNDDYNLAWLAETKILSDDDYEDEEEEGESDTEA